MRHGFSLVELSIVLVILGLLVGGILAGKSLIRASQLRSVSTEINRFTTASYAFRDKYLAIAGDMNNATSFWGAADNGDGIGTDCQNTESTDAKTCNGNGNGRIDPIVEYYRFWQHLQNAGLLEGNYTGAPTQPPYTANGFGTLIGGNVPASKFPKLAYAVMYHSTAVMFNPISSNYFILAGGVHAAVGNLDGRAMVAEDAWNIDSKIDDGYPNSGRLKSSGPNLYAGGCTTNPATTGDAYNLINLTGCLLYWNMNI